jgi:hypothetical protein
MTVYTANIPQPGDDPSQSQGQILQNFQSLQDAQDKNHVTLQDITNRGLHKFLQMPEQGSDPTTAVNQGGLYCKDIAGFTRLVFRQENNGTIIQMTGIDPVSATNGYTFLPGGLLLQWGTSAVNGAPAITNILFPITFPANCFNVSITPVRNVTNVDIVYLVAKNNVNFTARNTSSSGITSINWIAIGN